LTIIDDVCRGLAAVHATGAIHRDIKPSNVLLDARLHACVADLGLVASVGDDPALVDVAGTPAYMAPELTSDLVASAATQTSDVYALACVAFELLTGRHPFFDDDDDEPVNRGGRSIPRASELRRGLPRGFDQVLARGLASDPLLRTPTVNSFRQQLLTAGLAQEPERILIAEDDPDFLELVRCRLTREFPNAEVECVHDGADLVEAFERQPSSVVIVDLCLPRIDGFRVTSLLRAKKEAAEVPIVVLTGAGGARDWATLAELGANRFLVKPVDLDDLVVVTRNVLSAGPLSRRKALSNDGGAGGS
jgi:eukaryotic-like serine/threonine-protein kinase